MTAEQIMTVQITQDGMLPIPEELGRELGLLESQTSEVFASRDFGSLDLCDLRGRGSSAAAQQGGLKELNHPLLILGRPRAVGAHMLRPGL